ncbi:DgyrCDS7192 [Dimorphilus gyrociliatus]|uniref:DgyrCDS7192 n=1 Tax=Dimorphilus gyrociliatus TaxID=2664684 RepID=A0A7I8VQI7_9ANNE|nr:DgyrCDS7192 [Dimorphilus gyrociliatus]
MGILLSKIADTLYTAYSFVNESKPCRILLLGLDNAGKTSILYKVKLKENVCTIPTIGFNVETVQPAKGLNFTVWDVGGQKRLRALWHHYYNDASGLVFVVDSNDVERMDEAREELHSIMQDDNMRHVPVVVMANKQDLPNALSPETIRDKLQLSEISKQWYIQACSVKTGEGISESFLQMADLIKRNECN